MSATGLKDSDQDRTPPLSQRATIPPATGDPQAPHDNAVEPGAMPASIGQFDLKGLLGQGAMGMVYLAYDNRRKRDIALKIPTIREGEESETVQRFYREARTAATLSHPNICSIYQVGHADGSYYIAMQYIDGRPLSDFVRPDDPPPVDQVALIVSRIAAAMDLAHEKRIVHRDLKPDNILIDDNREPVVMDFGLALNANMATDVRLTQAGTIMGSPAYMSPEQIENDLKHIGPAADIYSLGVVFYELLTGRLPFEGSIAAVIAQILKDEPKFPSQWREGIHPTLDAVCLKMMAKLPAERYSSMGEVAAALGEFLKELEAAASPDSEIRKTGKIELTAFDRDRAIRDARIERLEMAKRHVENLRKDGAYSAAISMLEAIARLRDPRFAEYVQWARELIPVLREEPERIRSQLAEAADTARQLIERHEYKEAVELLRQIPRTLRSNEINTILKETVRLHAECQRLNNEIREDFKIHETDNTLPKVKRLLELRPQSRKAQQWYFKLTGRKYGAGRRLPLPPLVFWPVAALVLAVVAGVGWSIYDAFYSIDVPESVTSFTEDPDANNKTGIVPGDENGKPDNKVAPAPKVDAADPPKPNARAALGAPIDLLKLIDLKKHKFAGNWSKDDAGLVCFGGLYCAVQIPFTLPEEYQLTVIVTRPTGKQGLHVGLVKGVRQFTAVMDSGGKDSFLHVLNGKHRHADHNSSAYHGPLLKEGVPAEVVYTVHRSGVSIAVDGKTVIDWKGGFSQLTPYSLLNRPQTNSNLTLGSNNPFRFTKIELSPLTTPPVAVAVGGKVDLLKLIDPKKHRVAGNWSIDGTTLVNAGGAGSRLQIPYTPPEEYQINLTVTRLPGRWTRARPWSGSGAYVGLVAGGRQFIAGFDFRDKYTGLYTVDRSTWLYNNKSAYVHRHLDLGVPTNLSCRVLKSGVTLKANGRTVVDWKGSFSRLGLHSSMRVPNVKQLFLGGGEYRYSKIELQPLKTTPAGEKANLRKIIEPKKQ